MKKIKFKLARSDIASVAKNQTEAYVDIIASLNN